MKTALILTLVLIIAACSPVTMPAPGITSPAAAVSTTATGTTSTGTAIPTNTIPPSETPAPTSTVTPTPSPTPLREPMIAARYPPFMEDGLGYGSVFMACPRGQAWETTMGGGARVYNSADMTLLTSLDLGGLENAFSRVVCDDEYAWVLFFLPGLSSETANLFRISRTDFRVSPVNLPETCTYDACLWATLTLDADLLWLGGYDELMSLDRETLEPVAKYLFSEQAHTFMPYSVEDIDVVNGTQIWSLFCADVCYIVILDRQKLLDGVEQEADFINFESSWIEFVTEVQGRMWAAEARNGNVEEQPATLYPLEKAGVLLTPQDGIALPDNVDIFDSFTTTHATVGSQLWLVNAGGRRVYWFDTSQGAVAGEMQIYPGDEPSAADPNLILSISYDGQSLWSSGSEILRIAIP